jgi:tripartite-type tricarboxylate transporter receptor subunit TctC
LNNDHDGETIQMNKLKARFNMLIALTILVPLFGTATLVSAQSNSADRPIRIIVPFSPGGGTDTIARTLGAAMSQDLGQTVIIENKPGAGTVIGTDTVAKSAPDGTTILIATFAHAVNPSLRSKMPFDTEKAFDPVVLIGRSPNILVVPASSPYKNIKELVAAAKADPGKLTFASQGVGTSAHLAGELFNNLAGVNMTHIPYKGAGPALNDLLGGQVNMMFATATAAAPLIESGKVRALGVTTPGRSPVRPDVPSIAEAGVPGYAAESWYGFFVPAGTSAEIVNKLNAATAKAAQSETFRKRVEGEGLVITTGTPKELADYVSAEQKRWAAVVKAAKIEPN